MKLSTNFLKDYVDIDVPVKTLAEDMTRVGNEYDFAGNFIDATNLVIGEIKELDIGVSKSAEDEVSNRLAINQILSRFEKNDQNLIKLRYFAGKTQSETARLLGMTQVQISRREKKLLKIMSELL